MARVVAFVPDLLFGSSVLAAVRGAGHDTVLVSELTTDQLAGAEVLVVDLTFEAEQRIAQISALAGPELRTLGFYAHVEGHVREQAQAAGFDLVVPRSRMARSAGALVDQLLTGED